jgi:hypothetical protein
VEDLPAEIRSELAALDGLDDAALWEIARSRVEDAALARQDELLARNAEGSITAEERAEIERLREGQDRFMLRKAHAAALLRARGYRDVVP